MSEESSAPSRPTEQDEEIDEETRLALFLSALPPDVFDEQVAQMNGMSLKDAQSPQEAATQAVALGQSGYRYLASKSLGHIMQSISAFEQALLMIQEDHQARPWLLSGLACALRSRFDHSKDGADVERATTSLLQAVELTPDGHPHKASILVDLSLCFRDRFTHNDARDDLDAAVMTAQQAVDASLDHDILRPARLANLARLLSLRWERFNDEADMSAAISALQDAAAVIPDENPQKALLFMDVGSFYRAKFDRSGRLDDIDGEIAAVRMAINITPGDGPLKTVQLFSVAGALQMRFGQLNLSSDAHAAVEALHRNLMIIPQDDPARKALVLKRLRVLHLACFDTFGKLPDLDGAISTREQELSLSTMDFPAKLADLGLDFQRRFEHTDNLHDLDKSIEIMQRAKDLLPDGDIAKHDLIANLGVSFLIRYNRLGAPKDLEAAMDLQQHVVNITPDGDHRKAGYLTNLGKVYHSCFSRLGRISDLNTALDMHQGALHLSPAVGVRAACLINLGEGLHERFNVSEALPDIESAIYTLREALELCHDVPKKKPLCLVLVGAALRSRFRRLGDLSDLDEAISCQLHAVQLTPEDDPARFKPLTDYGFSVWSRFKCRAEVSDIEEALKALREADQLSPDNHASRPELLSSLGSALLSHFAYTGDIASIDAAIISDKRAVDLAPEGHAGIAGYLSNLGDAFRSRFLRLGEMEDLDASLAALERAVKLTPAIHSRMPDRLNGLAAVLALRFNRSREVEDINSAVEVLKRAVEATPNDHPSRFAFLVNLGLAHHSRFLLGHHADDVNASIDLLQRAVTLTSNKSADWPSVHANLGIALQGRFELTGFTADIDAAIDALRISTDLPTTHARKATHLMGLGTALALRFRHSAEPSDLDESITTLQEAVSTSSGAPNVRFYAARRWARLCAQHQNIVSCLPAYKAAIECMPRMVWVGVNVRRRFDELVAVGDIVSEAAAAAIQAGHQKMALEWLEEGRCVIWGQLLALRTPLDDLRKVNAGLADKLEQVAKELDHAGAIDAGIMMRREDDGAVPGPTLEEQAQRHHSLAGEHATLTATVRAIPGFERFLLPKELEDLRPAAVHGAVVLLNAHERRCDALVLKGPDTPLLHVPLPDLTLKLASAMRSGLVNELHSAGVRTRGSVSAIPHGTIERILTALWKHVARPVLDGLEIFNRSTPGEFPPRIFWCATGPLAFLPLHGAGTYDSTTTDSARAFLDDFVVSSYTPSLTALITASRKAATLSSPPSRILAVAQPATPGQTPLPGTTREIDALARYIAAADHGVELTRLDGPAATVQYVHDVLAEHDWVHLACHASQDVADATESAFVLHDGTLPLAAIMCIALPRGSLAVLSACQTAAGDGMLPQEAVHLAAGMLAAGYPSVVATTWSVGDADAPVIADALYQELLGKCRETSGAGASYALHSAVRQLRETVGERSFLKWLPFIHVGV